MLKPCRLSNEMYWTQDPAIEAARRLPDWVRFHRACGEQGLFFDRAAKEGRSGYTVMAFTTRRRPNGTYEYLHLADGRGKTVLDAYGDAYRSAARPVPEAEVLLGRGLTGVAAVDYEDMLG